jgi:uncharacterized membrane protein
MPFCTNCGSEVGPSDVYCGKCGAKQAAPGAAPGRASDPLRSVSRRTASMLCYIPIVGWIAAIVVLASPRYQRDPDLRFHAFQGIYLFVVYLLIDWVMAPMLHIVPGPGGHITRMLSGMLHLLVFAAWIWMIIKTSQEQTFSLPIIGELAERSVAEQR